MKANVPNLDTVSTTCGSGWLGDEHEIFLLMLMVEVDPPATAGGTDRIQHRYLTL